MGRRCNRGLSDARALVHTDRMEDVAVRIREPLRRFVLGPDYPDPASTHLTPDNYTAPVGFDGLAARLRGREPTPCHICGSRVPYQHRFWWCMKQLEKEAARRKPC